MSIRYIWIFTLMLLTGLNQSHALSVDTETMTFTPQKNTSPPASRNRSGTPGKPWEPGSYVKKDPSPEEIKRLEIAKELTKYCTVVSSDTVFGKTAEGVIIDLKHELFWTTDLLRRGATIKEVENQIDRLNKDQFGGFNDWRIPEPVDVMGILKSFPDNRNYPIRLDYYNQRSLPNIFRCNSNIIWTGYKGVVNRPFNMALYSTSMISESRGRVLAVRSNKDSSTGIKYQDILKVNPYRSTVISLSKYYPPMVRLDNKTKIDIFIKIKKSSAENTQKFWVYGNEVLLLDLDTGGYTIYGMADIEGNPQYFKLTNIYVDDKTNERITINQITNKTNQSSVSKEFFNNL